ncbi:hypothetical protein BH09ACT7_BH09ACT7_55960 [soil metagenome]
MGVDRVVEVAFKNLDLDARVLRPSGVISTYMDDEDATLPSTVDLHQLMDKDITVHFVLISQCQPAVTTRPSPICRRLLWMTR